MKVIGIIPARMASSRFPNKPLVDIGGKTMIQRVYEQALKSDVLSKVIVATDHLSIKEEVEAFGGKAVMTSELHNNGSERCAEVLHKLNENYDVAINIQGDEPFFEPESLAILVACFQNKEVEIATLAKQIEREEDIENPSVVKVVFATDNKALYFSRSPIPFNRDQQEHLYYKHIGIYAYKSNVLQEIVQLKESNLEKIERLEQLRWLENGYNIALGFTNHDSNSVDTPEDLAALKKQFNIEY